MNQQDNTLPQELIDTHLQAVLRAGGSNFSHYSMQKSKDDLRAAMRAGMLAGAHAIQHGAVAITIHDLSPSMVEGAVRDRLIDLGWTPPGVEWATDVHGHKLYPLGTIGEGRELVPSAPYNEKRIALELERVQGVLVGVLEATRPFIHSLPQCRDSNTPHIPGSGLLERVDAALAKVKKPALFNGLTEDQTNVSASVSGLSAQKTYYDTAGTLRNPDGSRSIFDDLDACYSCGLTPAQRERSENPEPCPHCAAQQLEGGDK